MNLLNKQEAKVALVTGGARRIGAAIVRKLHQAGYRVLIHCHHALNEAHALAEELNNISLDTALVLQRDLTQEDTPKDLVQVIHDWAGRLDVLVNNASAFRRSDCTLNASAEWDELFAVNVKAPFMLSLACRPLLAMHRGVVINITDIHAERPLKMYAAYCQSKAALEMQTKALALEFAPEIRVNAVAPGPTIWPEKANSLTPDQKAKIINKTLLKQAGNPEYVALAVLALIENPYITGQLLKVDAGRSVASG